MRKSLSIGDFSTGMVFEKLLHMIHLTIHCLYLLNKIVKQVALNADLSVKSEHMVVTILLADDCFFSSVKTRVYDIEFFGPKEQIPSTTK